MSTAKKEAARAALEFVRPGTIVGLGCGEAIRYLADGIAAQCAEGIKLQLVTSSFSTKQYLLQRGLSVLSLSELAAIDVYFDGCDQFDAALNALKSGGGIHTMEKLAASMAREFILVGDDTKYAASFTGKYPLVIELAPEAMGYVQTVLARIFPGIKTGLRLSDRCDGPVITTHGNYLLDCWFTVWPDLRLLHDQIKAITGVIESSLFYQLAHRAVTANERAEVKVFTR